MSISFRPGRLQTAPVAKRVLCLSERRRYRRVHAETTRAVMPAGETHQPRQCFPTNTPTVFRQRKLHAQISDAHVLVSASHPAHVEVGFTSQSDTEQLNVVFLPVSYSKQRHWLFNVAITFNPRLKSPPRYYFLPVLELLLTAARTPDEILLLELFSVSGNSLFSSRMTTNQIKIPQARLRSLCSGEARCIVIGEKKLLETASVDSWSVSSKKKVKKKPGVL